MPAHSTRTGALLATVSLAAGSLAVLGISGAASAAPGKSLLGKHDRELLASAKAHGDKEVTVLVAAKGSQGKAVADALAAAGATIRYRDDSLGYVRAKVATNKVDAISRTAGIQTINLNESMPLDDPDKSESAKASGGTTRSVPAPGPSTPDANSYMPTVETGAVAFKQAHPTWDGRGTVIGILDTGVDQDHPSLKTTSTGERKLLDWVAATDPVDDGDPTWIDMNLPDAHVSGGTFTWRSFTYTAPKGDYRMSRVREQFFDSDEMQGDVNRDGDTTDRIAVLWRLTDNKVLVDSDFDRDFADETPMTDYKTSFQVGHFGVDDPDTDVVESVPFTVQLDGKRKFVNIGVTTGEHGSHVAGIAAGNALFGGDMDGAAPGAKIVSVRVCRFQNGCSFSAEIEGMIYALKQAHVDVVNMSVGGLPALNSGESTTGVVYNRLVDQTGGQIFTSAGNSGAGLNTIGQPGDVDKVVGVGATVTPETYLSNYGVVVDPTNRTRLFDFSSRGPRDDGGLKPNIVAPGSAVSTIPLWLPDDPLDETGYVLPAGYTMLNGTSMASPQAAGAGALLVGAAKSAGVQHKPDQLRQALYSTADFFSGAGAFEQGHGQINVPAAWDVLKKTVTTTAIVVSAPVCNTVWQVLGRTRGSGLYNDCASGAGGQAVGENTSYSVRVARTSGGAKPVPVTLSWQGNDGTFSSAGSASLPLNTWVTVPVGVDLGSLGVHSAILRIDDVTTAGLDASMLATVVGSAAMDAPSYSFSSGSDSVSRTRSDHWFVSVPEGAPYLKVDLSGFEPDSVLHFYAYHPYGLPVDDTSDVTCYTGIPLNPCAVSRTYLAPQAGVWEISVYARRLTPHLNNPYQLSTQIVGVDVDPKTATYPSLTSGVGEAASYSFTNNWADVEAGAVGTALGSAFFDRPTISTGQQQTFTIDVPAGSSSLHVAINNPSDLGADLDLYLDGPNGESTYDADSDADEKITVDNPSEGTWTVTVDGYDVPSGSTQYDYLDSYAVPGLGSVVVTDATAARANGASWTAPAVITATGTPAAGRSLFGQVQVKTGSGAVIGTGDIKVLAVS